jgi:glycosyltransferase involved in cell wall biosynthesis/GT2 family glycosyltransferase
MSKLPRVSAVINTYNRAASLHNTLQAMLRQNYPHFEVIVVNGPSTDHTLDVLKAHASGIRVGSCSERNLSISRNVGIEMAGGDFVAFIDDDAVPDEDWLIDAIAAFDGDEVAGVGGFVYDHTGYELQYSYTLCDRMGNAYHNIPVSMPEFCYPGCYRYPALLGTNSIFRRTALLEIGGFDEQFDYFLDETDVNLRLIDAGYLLKQIPNAFVYHRYLPSHIRNKERVNTNYLPIIRNRVYFSLKNAASEPGHMAAILKDWAMLSRDALYNVNWSISQGKLDPATLGQFLQDLDVAAKEGMQLGLNRPRRLLHSETAKSLRGTTASDILDQQRMGQFKLCPILLPASQKLTICLLSQQYPPGVVGGIGRLSRDLAEGLAARGHNVHLLTRGSAIANTVDFEDGVWVHRMIQDRDELPLPDGMRVPPHLWRYSARMLRELRRIHEVHPIDIVEAPIWDVEGIAVILDGSFRVVTSLHTPLKKVVESNPDWRANMTPQKVQNYEDLEAAEILVATRAHGVRANSRAVVETMGKSYGVEFAADRLSILPHGMEDRSQRRNGAEKKGNFIDVLYAGRFEGRKGTDVLLKVIPALCLKHRRARFILVGEDRAQPNGATQGEEFRMLHRRADFRDRVIFAGEVSDEKLEAYLAQCDIFVAPSRYESFGLVFLEAMMFGKPVIGCRAGGMAEVIEEGVTGLLAEPGDTTSLESALEVLLSDAGKREAFGKAGRERYLQHYTREKLTDRTLEFYRQVLDHAMEKDIAGSAAKDSHEMASVESV